jgi:ABC-type ATPase with predicted acetyltransferase domain
MTKLILSKTFATYVERSERVMKVAEAFGIGLDDREFTVFKDLAITVNQGDVVFVTGQSGSGKSCLLREIAAGLGGEGSKVASIDDVEFSDQPLIDQIGATMLEATQLLSFAGISDAYLYIRRPSELSDGQRYRFCLAKLLEQNADVWVADEFGAVLDRTTAKVVAFNLQKVARKAGKTLILATTHNDLIDELGPDLIVRKRYQDRIEIEHREAGAWPDLSPNGGLSQSEIFKNPQPHSAMEVHLGNKE